jgi:hypothetical protein
MPALQNKGVLFCGFGHETRSIAFQYYPVPPDAMTRVQSCRESTASVHPLI